MLIAVYGVMSVVNLSANAAASYSPAPEKLTIEYKASNIPMSLWEYGYDIEDIVSSAKTSNKGTLGVYETTVDYDSYSLKDEIAIPEDGLVFDAKQYLNNSSDVIIITLRSSAFELNDYIYRTDDDAIESMSGICFGLSEDGSVVILASYFDSVATTDCFCEIVKNTLYF